MTKVTYDVTKSDPEKARSFEPPKPGVYPCRIKECKLGYKTGRTGKPDKTAPRVEVVYEIVGPKFKGSYLYDYLALTEAAAWKMDQFLQAVGVTNGKTKRKGTFEPEKLVGMKVKVRVKADTNDDGEYRAKPGSVMAWSSDGDDEHDSEEDDDDVDDEEIDDEDDSEDEDDDSEEEEDEEAEDDAESDEDEEDEEDDAEEAVLYYSESELNEMSVGALRDVASDLEMEIPSGKKKQATIAKWIFDNQPGEAPEDEDEEDEDDEETEDYSNTETWNIKALRKECSDRDLETSGKRVDLVKRLMEDDASEPF